MNISIAVIIWLAPFLTAIQMETSSLLLAGTLNVLRARTVQAARSMVAQTVPRARTAEHARVLAPPVPRASTAHPLARLMQATASTVPRASTAHPLARLIQAPASTVPRARTARPRAGAPASFAPRARGACGANQARPRARHVTVAMLERPAAGDNFVLAHLPSRR